MRTRAALLIVPSAIALHACGDGADTADARSDAAADAIIDGAVDAAVDASSDAAVWPALQLDVDHDDDGWISVSASDPARNLCTFYLFLRSGCEDVSDVRFCHAGPLAPWIRAVHVTSGAQVLATRTPVDLWEGTSFGPAALAGHDHLALVIEATDGQRAEIPMPAGVVPPQPTIDAVTHVGNEVHVTWSATPAAASAMVSVFGGTVGYRCHVAATQHDVVIPWMFPHVDDQVSVSAFATAPPIVTPLGDARVWVGGSAGARVPAPP